MADLDNIAIFVKVAQYESISRAARSLGMPISTVSRRLSVLESQLGATLLRRTTRRVSLTAQGRDYFNQCQEPLSLLQEAEHVLTQAQKKPEGLLRITVPVALGLMLHAKNNEADWDLSSGRRKVRVHVSGPVSSRDFNTVSTFVYRGHGIGLLPATYCDTEIAAARLVRLLPKWQSVPVPVFIVYPTRKFLPLRLTAFMQALTKWDSSLWTRD